MIKINAKYLGDLHCEATHEPSGAKIHTEAPADNGGKGEGFSPTDLVPGALGSCILMVMGLAARAMKIDITGSEVSVEKHMVSAPYRRIGKLMVHVHVPYQFPDDQRQRLEQAALTCPVHKSLHPDIEMPVTFTWGAKN